MLLKVVVVVDELVVRRELRRVGLEIRGVAWGGDGRWRENEVGAKEGEESY